MTTAILMAITDLGDAALLLPVALLLALVLWTQQSAAAALSWLGALLAALSAIAALKLVGHTCRSALGVPSLVSPSGHATFAAMVYGATAIAVARHTAGPVRWLALLGGAGIVLAVAASRRLIGAHSSLEVLVGLMIGALGLALFARTYLRLPPASFRSRRAAALAAVLALAAVSLHGERLHAEVLIRSIAAELRIQTNVCG